MAHPHFDIHLLTEACASATTPIQADITPIFASVVIVVRASNTLAADDAWVYHDWHPDFELSGVIRRQCGDTASEFMTECYRCAIASDAVWLLLGAHRAWPGGPFV